MKFNYKARTKKGDLQEGVVEASSKDAALEVLNQYGVYVTQLERADQQPLYAREINLFGGVTPKDIVNFSRQLSIMFESQVPLVEALHTLARQAENKEFQRRLLRIEEDVEAGTSLSDAFAQYPDIFSPLYINMLKSGEASGRLSEVMEYMADHLEREFELNSKIKGAMYYPAFVFVLIIVVLFAMMLFVIPNFEAFFNDMPGKKPLFTQIVFATSDFMQVWWWAVLIGMFVVFAAIFFFVRSAFGKKVIARLSLHLPIIAPVLKLTYLSRFAENLSTLIQSGIPIVQALQITSQVVGNERYQRIIHSAEEAVRQGASISSILERYPSEFAPVFTQMVYVGEQSGSLDTTLGGVVPFYRKEMDRKVDTMLKLMEPLILLVLALIVGGIMASVLLPMYQMIAQIQ